MAAEFKGDTVGVYLPWEAIEALGLAVKETGQNRSKWCAEAILSRLKTEGLLSESVEEIHDLELLREARAAGVDVEALITAALELESKEVAS